MIRLLATVAILALASAARGGPADVVAARVHCEECECLFAVTIAHGDEGFEHYADRYEVLAADGTLLGTRVLAHPHVEEQPFTRQLPGIRIPDGVTRVRIRARDSRHGFGGSEIELDLPLPAGDAEARRGDAGAPGSDVPAGERAGTRAGHGEATRRGP